MVAILYRFFPEGRIRGKEFLAKNPKRNDKSLGSFSINLNSGVWCDFTTNDRGGDLISLTAYLYDLSQGEAAKRLAQMVGVEI
ncbi:hypothetical protein FAI40_08545 [Acetobacteraceae bacterium]|nr:hypothetical protein FAI40_08545 [Acetobacteraceae bacterium]